VVDVVHHCLRIDQFDEVFNDLNDIFLGQYPYIDIDIEIEFFVNSVASHIAQVVSLLGEEKVVDYLACT